MKWNAAGAAPMEVVECRHVVGGVVDEVLRQHGLAIR